MNINIHINTYLEALRSELDIIEDLMADLLDCSRIKKRDRDYNPYVVVILPHFYWDKLSETQKRIQIVLKSKYLDWYERFNMLFNNAPNEVKSDIQKTHKSVLEWVELSSSWGVPSTIEEARVKFTEEIAVYYDLMDLLESSEKASLIIVPDTNALIKAPDFSSYKKVVNRETYEVYIVPTALEELDKLKVVHRDAEFRDKVESVIRRIKGLRKQGRLTEGVTVNKSVTVRLLATEPGFKDTLHWLDPEIKDDRIVASTLEIQIANPSANVILITSDINLQNKAEMAYIPYLEPPN